MAATEANSAGTLMLNRLRLKGAGVFAAMTAFNLAFFRGIWDGSMAFWYRDSVIGFLPTKLYLRERLLSGEWPLWSERVKGGMPFWADPVNGILYPGHLPLLAIADPLRAYGITVAFHYFLAQAGFYLLLRTLGRSRTASLLSSLAIAYSGAFIQKHENLQFLFAWSWLGWYLAALYSYLRRPGWLSGSLAMASFFAILTSGDIQTAYVMGGLTLLVPLSCPAGTRSFLRQTAQGAWPMLTAGLLAAPFLLPVYELSTRTTRLLGNTLEAVTQWSFHPFRWIEWFVPGPFGFTFSDASPFWARGLARTGFTGFYTPQSYFGILLIPLAAWALIRVRNRLVIFWVAIGLAAFLLAAGDALPFYGWFYRWLPLWGNFRYPERMLVWIVIAAGVLAAAGFDSLREETEKPWRHWVAVKMAVLAVLLWAVSQTVTPGGIFQPWFDGIRGGAASAADVATFTEALSRGAVFWLAGAAALAALLSGRGRALALFPLCFTAAELWIVNRPQAPAWPSENFRTPPSLIMQLLRDFPEEQDPSGLPARLFFNHEHNRIQWAGDENEAVALQIWNLVYGNLILLTPFSSPIGYNSSELTAMTRMLRSVRWSHYAALTDINYWLVLPETAKRNTAWTCGKPDPVTGLVWCRNPLPRLPVRCPSTWTRIDDPDQLLSAFRITPWAARTDFALLGSFDPRDTSGLPEAVQSGSGTVAATCAAGLWTDDRRTVRISRETEGPVVLRDVYYPGWRAVSEGRELPVIAANGGQLAVWSPAGTHEIELAFEPPPIRTGVLLALLGFVLNWALAWKLRQANGPVSRLPRTEAIKEPGPGS